jgi:outer membrane protein OmpA-like peptidoglycan-associated protein
MERSILRARPVALARGPSETAETGSVDQAASGARRHRRALTWLAWVVGVALAYTLIGFLLLPAALRPQVEHRMSTTLNRAVTIGSLDINPYELSATLRDVAIADRTQGPPAFTLDELYANVQAASLLRWAPVVRELRVTRPALNVVRNADGTYNFSDLVERALAQPSGPARRFAVNNIEIDDGIVTFDDRPAARHHEVSHIHLGIPFLSSLPSQIEIKVEPSLSALVNGRPVDVRGETRPFLDSRETVLHLRAEELSLPAYVAYAPAPLPLTVESGSLDSALDVRFVAHGSAAPELTVSGTVKLRDLALRERSGAALLRLPSLAVAIDKIDVFGRSADVRSIAADDVELDVRRGPDGVLNLATLGASTPATPATAPKPFAFHVGDIAVGHGTIRFADQSVRPVFVTTASDVALHVANLASSNAQDASVDLSLVTDSGARVVHRGALGLAPLHAAGRVEASAVKVAQLFPYYGSALNLVVEDGSVDVTTDFRFDDTGTTNAAVQLSNLTAKASEVKLRLPDEEQLLWRVQLLAVRGGTVDVARRTFHFEAIESRGAQATIRREADGTFNFARLVRSAPADGAKAATGDAWHIDADSLALDDYAADVEDRLVKPPGRLAVKNASLRAEPVSNAANARSRVALHANVGKSGSIDVSGPVTTAPFSASVRVVAKDVALVPLQPYVARAMRVVLTNGRVSGRGEAQIAASPEQRAAFKGEIGVDDLALVEEANAGDLLRWKRLVLTSVDARSAPLAVRTGDIVLQQFYARLMLDDTGKFNLQQLGRGASANGEPAPPAASSSERKAPPAGEGATTWLELGKATLSDGTIDFTDHFIRPNYSANLTGVSGTISALAFDQPAQIDLRGSVQGSAPVEIAGRINPLARDLFLDVKASATGIEMPPLSPYSGKYVGYGIEKGKLTMKVAYRVEDRKLKAENQIVLDQLTFGGKVDSPDAIKAPVLLAVALLKDRNGVIQFDLPVGGSLDDPQFSVGGLVFRALVNLIVKIVTAPFAFLGSLGGHTSDVSYIDFAPGQPTLDGASREKIQALAKGLKERPAIKVDVAGYVDRGQDGDALQRAAVRRQVQAQKFNDLVKAGEPPSALDSVEVPASEYDALLKRAYDAVESTTPANASGTPKDLSRDEMEAFLLANAKVTDEDLRLLGEHRALAVRAALVDEEQVAPEQVFVVAPRLDAKDGKSAGKPTRVEFALH